MQRAGAVSRLKDFEPRFRSLGIISLFLFGSTARDSAGSDSDLDLFIEYDPEARFSLFELVEAKLMVEDELQTSVDIATRDALHPRMRAEIESEAVQVFGHLRSELGNVGNE